MKKIEIKIPEIAENVESGLIAAVLVSKGDRVEKDQSLVEVETDKATTDIPSTHTGTVEEINVEEGDEVKVSQVIMVLSVEKEMEETSVEQEEQEVSGDMEEEKGKKQEKIRNNTEEEDEEDEEGEEDRNKDHDEDHDEDRDEDHDEDRDEEEEPRSKREKEDQEKGTREAGEEIAATPLVKRIAREEGIDLKGIRGSGPQGRITREDLRSRIGEHEKSKKEDTAKQRTQKEQAGRTSGSGESAGETREKMSTIRKLTAERMQESWQQIPHVTQFDQADITALEEFRQQQKSVVEREGIKLTVTALLLKITAYALQRFPRFNARLNEASEEIIYRHEIHIGVAVDTDRGLMVPVIRDVNRKSLTEISGELNDTAEKARNKKISPDELQGGTFTLSNLGGIGGTAFTPIVYAPQVAILGVSRSRFQPAYMGEKIEKRLIMPLSLSYDHRVIDGAEGARFLSWICSALENPFALLQ